MAKFVFVGEQRSGRAKLLGVTWHEGRLAAKPLFDALKAIGIEPERQRFYNWFESDVLEIARKLRNMWLDGYTIVAMGRKVQAEMVKHDIPHVFIVHPAARGKIRLRENYQAHVRQQLGEYIGE